MPGSAWKSVHRGSRKWLPEKRQARDAQEGRTRPDSLGRRPKDGSDEDDRAGRHGTDVSFWEQDERWLGGYGAPPDCAAVRLSAGASGLSQVDLAMARSG